MRWIPSAFLPAWAPSLGFPEKVSAIFWWVVQGSRGGGPKMAQMAPCCKLFAAQVRAAAFYLQQGAKRAILAPKRTQNRRAAGEPQVPWAVGF